MTGRVRGNSAKTKSGIGPRLHLNSAFQLVLTVNPQLFAISKGNIRHETLDSGTYVVYTNAKLKWRTIKTHERNLWIFGKLWGHRSLKNIFCFLD